MVIDTYCIVSCIISGCIFLELGVTYKKLIQFLECSWNHEYFGLLQSTLQEIQSIHDSMTIPKIEFIAYIYILL